MVYVKKWKKENGDYLTLDEYNLLRYDAKRKGIDFKSYFAMYGIKENNEISYLQDPVNNTAKLTYWVKEIEGNIYFLTKWKYKLFIEIANLEGKDIETYLKGIGFKKWSDLFDEPVTGWISKDTKYPLTRKDYKSEYNNLKDGETMEQLLKRKGYIKINSK